MADTFTCSGCERAFDALDAFPGNKCLGCHAADPAVQHQIATMTGTKLAAMWAGKPYAGRRAGCHCPGDCACRQAPELRRTVACGCRQH